MSRIGWAIRDTMSIGNDAPRVNVWERGRPSFQLLLNARDPTPGHSYLRLLRRKAILLRVYAPTAGKRDFDKHLFDSYKHGSSSGGAWPHCPRLPDVFAFSKCPESAGRFGIQCQ